LFKSKEIAAIDLCANSIIMHACLTKYMSETYRPQRKIGLFDPVRNNSEDPENFYEVDWQKMLDFLTCLRCFYYKYNFQFGLTPPPGKNPSGLYLQSDLAVKEFFRQFRGEDFSAELVSTFGAEMSPGVDVEKWLEPALISEKAKMKIVGCLDDLWLDRNTGIYHLVNYSVGSEEDDLFNKTKYWQKMNRRQLDFNYWLLRQVGMPGSLSNKAIMVIADIQSPEGVDGVKLDCEFDALSHNCSDHWVQTALIRMRKVLSSMRIPRSSKDCDLCSYIDLREDSGAPGPMDKVVTNMRFALDKVLAATREKTAGVREKVGERVIDVRDRVTESVQASAKGLRDSAVKKVVKILTPKNDPVDLTDPVEK
jgi:hypothetical protein